MAPRKANAAHLESLGESLSAEESTLMADNQAAEHETREESEPAPEPQKEAAAETPTPEAEAKADIDPETGKQRKVDYGAFHAEREKRKAADTARQDAEKQLATALGRFSVLEQLAKQQAPKVEAQPTAEAIPDINVDPVGHFRAKFEQSERTIADINKWRETQEGERTAMNNVQRLTQIALQHEGEFSKKTPDYQEAASYVRNVRDQELQAMGYADPGIRQQIITQDALQIAAQALQNNMNAAEVVYNIAKARGYAVKAPTPQTPPPPPSPPAGDIKKLATVIKGQEQASPLSEANGGGGLPEFSPLSIVKMSDDEFAKWATESNWKKMMGGS